MDSTHKHCLYLNSVLGSFHSPLFKRYPSTQHTVSVHSHHCAGSTQIHEVTCTFLTDGVSGDQRILRCQCSYSHNAPKGCIVCLTDPSNPNFGRTSSNAKTPQKQTSLQIPFNFLTPHPHFIYLLHPSMELCALMHLLLAPSLPQSLCWAFVHIFALSSALHISLVPSSLHAGATAYSATPCFISPQQIPVARLLGQQLLSPHSSWCHVSHNHPGSAQKAGVDSSTGTCSARLQL